MDSPVLPKTKEDQRWLASTFVGVGPPGTENPYYIGPLIFPLIIKPKVVLGYDLGGSRLGQGCCQGF